jgi:hypothetical protein
MMRLKGLTISGIILSASFLWAAENATTFHHNFQRTGRTTNVATKVPNVLWSYKTQIGRASCRERVSRSV